jgi:quinol monooxygenase YgiN
MTYHFREEKMDEALEIWKGAILEPISKAPGFHQVVMLRGQGGLAVAMGMWDSRESADAFMATGAAKKLFDLISPYFSEKPQHLNMTLEILQKAESGK